MASAWWPIEGASTQQMHVEVRDGFTTVGAVVDHDAETLGETELTGELTGNEQQMPESGLVFHGRLSDARDGLTRHDQNVSRGLRGDVMESHADNVLMDELRGNLLVGDLLKQRLRGAHGKSEDNDRYATATGLAGDEALDGINGFVVDGTPAGRTGTGAGEVLIL